MKKSLALLMVLVLMVAMLAGCGTSTEKDESVVIYQIGRASCRERV